MNPLPVPRRLTDFSADAVALAPRLLGKFLCRRLADTNHHPSSHQSAPKAADATSPFPPARQPPDTPAVPPSSLSPSTSDLRHPSKKAPIPRASRPRKQTPLLARPNRSNPTRPPFPALIDNPSKRPPSHPSSPSPKNILTHPPAVPIQILSKMQNFHLSKMQNYTIARPLLWQEPPKAMETLPSAKL